MISRCVHCLRENIEVTSDHVFPSSWYPSTTSAEVNRLTAPSCIDCNRKLGRIEESLLKVFSIGFSPKSPGHSEIYEKFKRSITESAGRNDKDKLLRNKAQKKFFNEIFPAHNFPKTAIANPENLEITLESLGKLLNVEELNIFLNKMTRGIIYNFAKNKFISEIYEITFQHFQIAPKEINHIPFVEKSFGPGFSFRFWEDQEYSPNSVIEITIWTKLKFLAFIENRILIPNGITI